MLIFEASGMPDHTNAMKSGVKGPRMIQERMGGRLARCSHMDTSAIVRVRRKPEQRQDISSCDQVDSAVWCRLTVSETPSLNPSQQQVL
jgi:hypothetical protein